MEHRIMTDKDVSDKELSENNQTEKKEPTTSSSGAKTNTTVITDKNMPSPASKKTDKAAKNTVTDSKNTKTEKKSNKAAYIAIALATVSIFSSIGHYVWQQQQNSTQLLAMSQQNQQTIQQSQEQLKKALTAEFNRQLQQQHRATSQSQQSAKQAHLDSDAQIELLTAQVSQLEQQVSLRQPSDWLVHEAEYLVRVAARTMWLERDTKAAISLLRDADNRLKELDQSKFLPVRALINEDIENLALMPVLQNHEAVLTLMALNKQVPTLVIITPERTFEHVKEDITLSDDIGDWQENLAKTWQKFLNDFITVRRRTGMIEPLMTPEQQQNLKQNLSLKVQLVQWAASEQKEEVYQQTLLDIQQWLNEFFDMNIAVNQKFYQAIEQLKQQTIYYDYPSNLRSSTAMKHLLDNTKQGLQPPASKTETLDEKKADQAVADDTVQTPVQESTKPSENEPTSGGQL